MNWISDLEKNYKAGTKVFLLYGNVHDIFNYGPQTGTLRCCLEQTVLRGGETCSYDCSAGLRFSSTTNSARFFKWLEIYDEAEKTNYSIKGLPKDFLTVLSILKRYLKHREEKKETINVFVNATEAIFPNDERGALSQSERETLVGFIYGHTIDFTREGLRIFLVAESLNEINNDITNSDYVYRCQVEFPNEQDRLAFLKNMFNDALPSFCDLSIQDLAKRTAGLNLIKILNMLNRAIACNERVTYASIAAEKKRIIEDFCQGLVRFKEPKPGLSLDCVATHARAKEKLRELVKLLKAGKENVIEKGILIPGRVGVGKSFLVDCFASECGLPVMELAEFRSKWVGDTEKQLARVLLTIKSLGPVVVVVDEADAVFGNRSESGDSGVSSRVFATLAAHIGDSSIRGREIWIAMTSRPDLLSIDMKRQGRFGLCIPLFQALNVDETRELFSVVIRSRKVKLLDFVDPVGLQDIIGILDRFTTGDVSDGITGSEVESIIIRAEEAAVLDGRNAITPFDLKTSVESFIDPLDKDLIKKQVFAAIRACTDKRFIPKPFLQYL